MVDQKPERVWLHCSLVQRRLEFHWSLRSATQLRVQQMPAVTTLEVQYHVKKGIDLIEEAITKALQVFAGILDVVAGLHCRGPSCYELSISVALGPSSLFLSPSATVSFPFPNH